jgi:hypothetical protein
MTAPSAISNPTPTTVRLSDLRPEMRAIVESLIAARRAAAARETQLAQAGGRA